MLQASLRRARSLNLGAFRTHEVTKLGFSTAADASPAPGNSPATQEVVSQVPLTTQEEFKAAVGAAKQAFSSWRNTPVTTRQHVMLKLQELIRRDMDKLALNITTEQGKTLRDAHGDVFRGLEVVEHACGMASLQMGEFVSNVSNGIDTYSMREPLGVCAGICPFNFPAMIPLWMLPVAVTCGNTFVLKPSEKDPDRKSIVHFSFCLDATISSDEWNLWLKCSDYLFDDASQAIKIWNPNHG